MESEHPYLKHKSEVLPWAEKYRPSTLEEIISHENIISVLQNSIENNELQHLLFHGPPGTGKCLSPETPVLLYNGKIKYAYEITTNDVLMGNDITPRYVINTTQGYDTMYEIIQDYGEPYIVNSCHILSLKSFDPCQPEYIDVCIKDLLEQPELLKKYGGYKCKTIEEWKNVEIIEKDFNPYNFGYLYATKNYDNFNNYDNYDNYDNNNYINNNYVNNNYINNTSFIPNKYKLSNIEIRSNILEGYIDSTTYLQNIYCKQYFNIPKDIKFIAYSLGFNIYFDNDNNIVKQKIPDVYSISIKQIYYGKYCGFEISGNRRFVLGDFTVTHNTSVIMACAKQLYGDNIEFMTINVNASEERGIEVVRNKILPFVNSRIMCDNPKSFKMVILDESDAMTADAQAALQKVIENYSDNTRFCLICNYIKKISQALQSRCTCYRFTQLLSRDMRKKIMHIIRAEKIKITESGITTIIKRSKGDMRKLLNLLQALSMSNSIINEAVINRCLGYPSNKYIEIILDSLINESFSDSYKTITQIKTTKMFSLQDIITEISDFLINSISSDNSKILELDNSKKLNDKQIMRIIKLLSKIEYNLSKCSNESLQLNAVIGTFKISNN